MEMGNGLFPEVCEIFPDWFPNMMCFNAKTRKWVWKDGEASG